MKLDIKKARELKTEASLLRMCRTARTAPMPRSSKALRVPFGVTGELFVREDSRAPNKILHLSAYEDRREDIHMVMFKSGNESMFNLPNFDAPKNCWLVAALYDAENAFLNALFVGNFNECLNKLFDFNLAFLQKEYTNRLVSQGSNILLNSRQKLLDDMAHELLELERSHEHSVAFVRNKYRTQLSELTTLIDNAQADADKKEKASYSFELYGYPESKQYGSFKEARRAHSRRNVPETACVMYRHTAKKKTKFAKWSLADRIWNIL